MNNKGMQEAICVFPTTLWTEAGNLADQRRTD